MPLIVICGQPASGKTTVSAALAALLRQHEIEVEIIDEPSVGGKRNVSYKDTRNEKQLRAALRSAVERRLTRSRAVVLDSLNNIKGFRYELWCAARSAATRYCVVWCDAGAGAARQRNAPRPPDEEAYSSEILEDLLRRFEAPDSRNRWDKPLFRLQDSLDEEERGQLLKAAVSATLGLAPEGGPAPRGPATAGEELRPTPATAMPPFGARGPSGGDVDSAVQSVVSAIAEAQADAGATPVGRLALDPDAAPLALPGVVALADLRRHKRAFLRLSHTAAGCSPDLARRLFVEYLRDHLD